jgi:hypothetical protein
MDLYGEFEWRGLVYDATEGVRDAVTRESITVYSGFDPTAPVSMSAICFRRCAWRACSGTGTRRSPSLAAAPG